MRAPLDARTTWLTVFRLPPYTPGLNPTEGVRAHLKKRLANLAACTIRQLAAKARTRLKKMQYRPRPPQRLHPRDRPDLHHDVTSPRTASLSSTTTADVLQRMWASWYRGSVVRTPRYQEALPSCG